MRKFRTVALAVAFTAALVASQGTAVAAKSGSKVKGVGTVDLGGVFYSFSFNGSANTGGFTILNVETRESVSGRASCYDQTGQTAVIAGLINKRSGTTEFNTSSYLVITGFDTDSAVKDEIDISNAVSATCEASDTEPIATGYVDITP